MNKSNTPEELVASIEHLVSLPDIYVHFNKILKDPDHTLEDIVEVVNYDPAICARILKVINSAYYSLPNPVGSISIAVNLIGEQDLRNMVIATSVVNSISLLADSDVDILGFWRHSIRCGISARLLAKFQTKPDTELLFLSGLLHDLGRLVISNKEHELSELVTSKVNKDKTKRYLTEQEVFGFDHATVGALLTETWNLPMELTSIIKHHHQPELSPIFYTEARLIYIADHLAHFMESQKDKKLVSLDALPILIYEYLTDMDISIEEFLTLLEDIKEQSQAIESIICS